MASTQKYGTQTKFRPSSLKRDTRSGLEKIHLKLTAPDGANYLVGVLGAIAVILFVVPFGGEIFIGIAYYLLKRYTHPNDYFLSGHSVRRCIQTHWMRQLTLHHA